MKKQFIFALIVAAASIISSQPMPAYGQWYVAPRVYGGYYGGGYGVGYGGGFGAQTPGGANATGVGNLATGMGNLVRSQGAYNEETAKALNEYESARSKYIDNQLKLNQARIELKRESQAQALKDRENARMIREQRQEFAEAHRPLPLTSMQLDPSSGEIRWPGALRTSDFDGLRTAIESLFQTKVKYGATSELSSQIVKKTGEMKDLLRGKILVIPLPDYTESRRFLESMIASAR